MKALSVKKSGNDRKILCVLLLQDIERYFYLAQSQWENHNQDFHQKIWKCQRNYKFFQVYFKKRLTNKYVVIRGHP